MYISTDHTHALVRDRGRALVRDRGTAVAVLARELCDLLPFKSFYGPSY